MTQDFLSTYLNSIMQALEFDKLPEQQRADMENAFRRRMQKKLVFTALQNLSSEQAMAFNQLLDSGADEQKIADFFQTATPDFRGKLTAAMAEFQRELEEDVKKMNQAPV